MLQLHVLQFRAGRVTKLSCPSPLSLVLNIWRSWATALGRCSTILVAIFAVLCSLSSIKKVVSTAPGIPDMLMLSAPITLSTASANGVRGFPAGPPPGNLVQKD